MVVSANRSIAPQHTQLLQQLRLLLFLFFGATWVLYTLSISQSFTQDAWLDHRSAHHQNDDDDGSKVNFVTDNVGDTVLSKDMLHRAHYDALDWKREWLAAIPPEHNGSPQILYVHVGKTGGLTLEKGIPIQIDKIISILKCVVHNTSNNQSHHQAHQLCSDQVYQQVQYKPTKLARNILAHKHLYSVKYNINQSTRKDQPDLMNYAIQHLDTFLVTTRNPVDRIVSSFNYLRNELVQTLSRGKGVEERVRIRNAERFDGNGHKQIFYNCFPDVRAMADELGREFHLIRENGNSTLPTSRKTEVTYNQMTCVQLAKTVLLPAETAEFSHFSYNYRMYKTLTIDKRPDVPLLVIRTKHLWHDATNIEQALGGNSSHFLNTHQVVSHGSESFKISAKLETALQKRALCCALYDDLQAYQDIIFSALNLNSTEKHDCMKLVYEDCGLDVDSFDRHELHQPRFWESWFARSCNGSK